MSPETSNPLVDLERAKEFRLKFCKKVSCRFCHEKDKSCDVYKVLKCHGEE